MIDVCQLIYIVPYISAFLLGPMQYLTVYTFKYKASYYIIFYMGNWLFFCVCNVAYVRLYMTIHRPYNNVGHGRQTRNKIGL